MDTTDGIAPMVECTTLSYDDSVAYEEQLPTEEERAAEAARTTSLANRIGNSRVYLLSESSAATTRSTKQKHEHEGENGFDVEADDEAGASDPTYRNNAILFNGGPIAHLPTARLFAYATHFDAHPMGLEWVDDQTCVFVFASVKDAKEAFSRLTKPSPTMPANAAESAVEDVAPMAIDDPVDPDYVLARHFPVALWPPEERINLTLGKGQGLKGPIHMRWARVDDVKKRGAKHVSQFYKRHGSKAGKELFNGRDLPPPPAPKRRRQDMEGDEETWKKTLDKELDDFLAEDDTTGDVDHGDGRRQKRTRYRSRTSSRSPSRTPSSNGRPPSPPSKMRSDYIASDGRTLLERTSSIRYHPLGSDPLGDVPDLASRLIAPLPKRRRRGGRARNGRNGDTNLDVDSLSPGLRPTAGDKLEWGRSDDDRDRTRRDGRRERERKGKGAERPKKTQQELDDELDTFLNAKD